MQTFQGRRAERLMFAELLDDKIRHDEIHGRRSLVQTRSRVKRLKLYFIGHRALAITRDVLPRYVEHRQRDARNRPSSIGSSK